MPTPRYTAEPVVRPVSGLTGPVDAYLLSQSVLSGLVIGLIYSLMALGITFIYGIMKMINWSMGEFYMIGSYAQYLLVVYLLGPDLWYVAALLSAALAAVVTATRSSSSIRC